MSMVLERLPAQLTGPIRGVTFRCRCWCCCSNPCNWNGESWERQIDPSVMQCHRSTRPTAQRRVVQERSNDRIRRQRRNHHHEEDWNETTRQRSRHQKQPGDGRRGVPLPQLRTGRWKDISPHPKWLSINLSTYSSIQTIQTHGGDLGDWADGPKNFKWGTAHASVPKYFEK